MRHIYIALHNHQLFSYMVLNVDVSTFYFFNSPIKHLICAFLVEEYCLLSSERKERNTAWRGDDFVDDFISICGNLLKYSNEITSIYTDIFPP